MRASEVTAGRPDFWDETITVRGLACRLHCSGRRDGEPLLLLHGWGDTGATFRFFIESLGDQWRTVAPDWRGFGDSGRSAGGYWFPDYLADLDRILDHVSPDRTVCIVGHSMGGNVAGLYAGVRPERVRALVLVEGFGMLDANSDHAPERYRRWLDELREASTFRRYPSVEAFAERLRSGRRHLDAERARFIAEAWSCPDENGMRVLKADPAHRRINPVLYRRAEAEACWRKIRAPVLLVAGGESQFRGLLDDIWERRDETGVFPNASRATIPDAGHMIHHEQPERLAAVIDAFLRRNGDIPH
ncbi:alpha/beta hydrolase [soil metagenome]